MGRATLQTIADQVGVSRATASNAFSRPDQLSASLRARILATAEELGYAGPHPTARMVARGTTGAVGVLLPESLRHAFTDEVLTAFLGAFADALAPTGLALTLLPASEAGDVVPVRDVPMGRPPGVLLRARVPAGRPAGPARCPAGAGGPACGRGHHRGRR